MEVICAGFPKTGSKSCTRALRELGYNVADIRELYMDLYGIWKQYFEGEVTITDVIGSGLQCVLIEIQCGNSPNTVPYSNSILTVRMARLLFLRETDTECVCGRVTYLSDIKLKALPSSLSGLSLHTVDQVSSI